MPKGGARTRSGPARTPTAIRKLQGGVDQHRNKYEPQAKAGAPRRPTEVKGRAKREWDLIIPELQRLGVLATCDRVALAGYALASGRFFDLTHDIDALGGEWAFTPTGTIEINRITRQRDKAEAAMLRFLVEFGLTPSSRARVHANAEQAEVDDDPAEAFFRERRLRLVGGSDEAADGS